MPGWNGVQTQDMHQYAGKNSGQLVIPLVMADDHFGMTLILTRLTLLSPVILREPRYGLTMTIWMLISTTIWMETAWTMSSLSIKDGVCRLDTHGLSVGVRWRHPLVAYGLLITDNVRMIRRRYLDHVDAKPHDWLPVYVPGAREMYHDYSLDEKSPQEISHERLTCYLQARSPSMTSQCHLDHLRPDEMALSECPTRHVMSLTANKMTRCTSSPSPMPCLEDTFLDRNQTEGQITPLRLTKRLIIVSETTVRWMLSLYKYHDVDLYQNTAVMTTTAVLSQLNQLGQLNHLSWIKKGVYSLPFTRSIWVAPIYSRPIYSLPFTRSTLVAQPDHSLPFYSLPSTRSIWVAPIYSRPIYSLLSTLAPFWSRLFTRAILLAPIYCACAVLAPPARALRSCRIQIQI